MSKKFILIGHKKRQGKDTFAKMLKEELGDAEIMSFADPMKQIMAQVFGISVEQLDLLKNTIPMYRDMIKSFGNGKMIELFGETVWRDLLIKRAEASNAEYIIVPDFRFNREFIEGSITINMVRDASIDSDDHQSETELDTYLYDIGIGNNSNLEALRATTASIADCINDLLIEREEDPHSDPYLDKDFNNLLKDDEHQANMDKVLHNYPDGGEIVINRDGDMFHDGLYIGSVSLK